MRIYLKLIRPWLSPLLYFIIKYTIYLNKKWPDKWDKIKDYHKYEFEAAIDEEYKWDGKYGILDFSLQDPDFYFIKKRKYFRDCDDTARMWFLWAKENGYKAWEVCVWKGFKRAHFITVFKDNNGYVLCNYKLSGTYSSLEAAVKSLKIYDNWLIYKEV